MNRETLLNALESQLKGKSFNGYDIAYSIRYNIYEIVKDILSSENISIINLWVEKSKYSNNTFNITYLHYTVATIEITKKKGEYIRYGHYAWVVNSITLSENFIDWDTSVHNIDNMIATSNKNKADKQQEMLGYYKQVKALLGDNTSKFLDYMRDNRWSIESLAERG